MCPSPCCERAILLETRLDQRLQHAVLAAKEVVQGGFRDAGSFADFSHRGSVVALDGKEIERRAENALRRCRLVYAREIGNYVIRRTLVQQWFADSA